MLFRTIIVLFPAVLYCVVGTGSGSIPAHEPPPFSGQDHLDLHTISHGAVFRDENGLIFLYLGPDQTNFPSMWGTINVTSKSNGIVNPICRQLGYESGDRIPPGIKSVVNSSVPVWLTDINCDNNTQHILRCNFSYSNNYSHDEDLYIDCYSPITNNNNAFTGQVILFPTTPTEVNISTSFGMVVIRKIEGANMKHISISPEDAVILSTSVADTLCREMGYTHGVLNSAWTKGKYEKMGYKFYGDVDNAYPGISSSRVNCTASCQCIQCCMNSTELDYDDQSSTDNALVLGCTFSNPLGKIAPEGSKEICEDVKNNDATICPPLTNSYTHLPTKDIISIVSGIVGGVLLIVLAVLVIVFVWRNRHRWGYRWGYGRIEGRNGEPHGGGRNGGPHGGGNGIHEEGNGGNGGNGP